MRCKLPVVRRNRIVTLASLAWLGLLSGCGGGGDGTLDLQSANPANIASAQGFVAVGQVIAHATVDAVCAKGVAQTLSTGADGRFVLASEGRDTPCAIRVTGGTVNGAPNTAELYSVMHSFDRVNVTPLTTLLVAHLSGESPASFYAGFNDSVRKSKVTAEGVTGAASNLRYYLQNSFGLTEAAQLSDFNPVTGVFEASVNDAHDQLLEALSVKMSTDGVNLATMQGSLASFELPPCSDASGFCWPTLAYKALAQGRVNEKGEPEAKFHEHDVNIEVAADGAWAKTLALKSDKIGKIQNFDVDVVARSLAFIASYHTTPDGNCSYAVSNGDACFEAVYGAMVMMCGPHAGDDFVLMPAATVAKDSASEVKAATASNLFGLSFDRIEACASAGNAFRVDGAGNVSDESDGSVSGLISKHIGKDWSGKKIERKFWQVASGTKSKYIGIETGVKNGQPHFVVLVQQ